MAKATTKLNAEDRVILFCAATGIDHAAVGILAHAMQSHRAQSRDQGVCAHGQRSRDTHGCWPEIIRAGQ